MTAPPDRDRPRPDDVVRDLRRAQREEEVAHGRQGRHRGSRPWPGRRRVALAVVLAAAVAAGALSLAGSREPAPARAASAARSWADVLVALDAARSAAFAAGDVDGLAAVDLPGSAAARSDRRALDRLVRAGVRPRGLRLDVAVAGVIGTDAARVRLRVVDARPSYELVDASGAVVRSVAARPARAWRVELRAVGEQWRVARVRPIGTSVG